METVATCKSCKGQDWKIYENRIECSCCKKTHNFGSAGKPEETLKAQDLVHMTNTNA